MLRIRKALHKLKPQILNQVMEHMNVSVQKKLTETKQLL